MKILLFLFLKLCGALVLVGLTVWGIFALQFQVSDLALRFALMLLWVGLALLGLYAIFLGTAWFALPYLVGSLVLGVWWNSIEPSNGRRWAPEVERVSYGQVQGTIVTMHNVRDFVWRSENDFDERWQTRQYDLERLSSVDMFLSYWMGPSIAHTLVSFGFSDGQQVVFSVEIRKEENEAFSAIGGFFKQFEMTLIAAQESDIIRTRTNIRGEDVYMYSVALSKPAMQALFLSYVQQGNDLHGHPRFYNTLTANCTTIVYDMVSRIVGGLVWDWRVLASGYLPEYVYALGALAPGYSLEAIQRLGHVNERALGQREGEDFSRVIRRDVPVVSR